MPAGYAAIGVCSLWCVVKKQHLQANRPTTYKCVGPSRLLSAARVLLQGLQLRRAEKPQTPVTVGSSVELCSLGNQERKVLRKIPLLLFAKRFHFLSRCLALVFHIFSQEVCSLPKEIEPRSLHSLAHGCPGCHWMLTRRWQHSV